MNERILSQVKISMLDYPTKILLSKQRKAKHFKQTDYLKKMPEKYRNVRYTYDRGILIDRYTKLPVVSNPGTVGTEKYQMISGNEMFARVHESIRYRVVEHLKTYFKAQITLWLSENKLLPLKEVYFKNPIHISMSVENQFGVGNWDVDNLWIYHKCFYDSLSDMKMISNDNVIHIRKGGSTEFIPILPGNIPKMTFHIDEIEIQPSMFSLTLVEDSKVDLNEILIGDLRIHLGTGKKKIVYGAAQKAIRKAMYHCLNHNITAIISKELFERYEKFFECFPEHRVKLIKSAS